MIRLKILLSEKDDVKDKWGRPASSKWYGFDPRTKKYTIGVNKGKTYAEVMKAKEPSAVRPWPPDKTKVSNYGFWDSVIDTFLPGTPVADGRKLLSKFDSIIKRRIDYNRNNNLPIETLTQEERSFRQTLFNATPPAAAPYPDYFGLIKLIQDIKQGKNIQPNEFKKYKKNNTDRSFSDLRKNTESGDELKKMWLGLDDPDGANKGYWITSEFKPTDSSNSNAIYYRPKDIPKLTAQQFDELYNAIMKTKLSNGKFPGGNSDLIYKEKLKYVPTSFLNDIEADLGEFKFGAAVENGRKFISVYDTWDLMPPKLNQFNIDVNKYGKTYEIFYRIYK